jgi:hypothetical protein
MLGGIASAQQTVTATIDGVATNGLHKILLPPEIRSFSNFDLSDFRIYEGKNEVPYVIARESDAHFTNALEDFKIIERNVVPGKRTSVIIENPKAKINGITLFIANSEVVKPYNLSGSNDGKQWFGLINNGVLNDLQDANSTTATANIAFPLCSYKLLKFDLDDKKTLPINILKAGLYNAQATSGRAMVEVYPKKVATGNVPNEKKTLIHVTFDYPQYINKIAFNIKSPIFKRDVRIYYKETRKVRKRIEIYDEDLSRLTVGSDVKNTFDVSWPKIQEFFIEIDNRDNPPLEMAGIQFFQKPIFAIADLKLGKSYVVKTGNANMRAPDYDLSYFAPATADTLPEVAIAQIKHQTISKATLSDTQFWQQPWFMWLCISLGGIAILYFSASLVKDMKQAKG